MGTPNILIYDIETIPAIMASFSLWPNSIPHSNIIQDWRMVCASWKWLGKKSIHAVSVLDDPKRFKKDPNDDYHVCKELRKVMAEADIVVGHNIVKFDNKKVNTRLISNGLEPLTHLTSVDTLKIAKRHYGFTSNRLDFIAQQLGYEGKMTTSPGLWMRCLRGDEKAIKEMVKYNKEDIRVSEDVYLKLRPYMDNHPALHRNQHDIVCPQCGSKHVTKDGTKVMRLGKFQMYRCQDCGHKFRDSKALERTRAR